MATAVAAAFLLAAAPALAAPTNVTWPSAIKVQAAPATENFIRIGYAFLTIRGPTGATTDDGTWTHVILDPAGVTTVEHTDRPSCFLPSPENQLGPNSVHCPDGTSVAPYPGVGEDFVVFLEDQNDTFDVRHECFEEQGTCTSGIGEFEVHAGSGNDRVYGNDEASYVAIQAEEEEFDPESVFWTQDDLNGDQGSDLLVGGAGADFLSGGPGADTLDGGIEAATDALYTGIDDTLLGGSGNDLLKAWHGDRDQVIDCGPGKRDKAIIDRGLDPKPKGCERVKKKPPAGAIS